ncbi:MAG: hypothetical protein ACM34K_18175 [Bacillota bacterium]
MKNYAGSSVTVFIIFLLISFHSTKAQLSGGIDYSLIYNDNPYRLSDGSEEFVNSYMVNLGYQPLKEKLNLSYSFGLNDFRNIADRSYNLHSFGFNYSFKFLDTSQEEENVSFGASYTLKQNNSDDKLYKYNAYSFSASGKFYLTDNLLFVSGYKFNKKNYPSLFNLTYTDNSAYLRSSLFFETGTALHLETQLGNRAYSIKNLSQGYSTSSQYSHQMGRMGRSADVKTTDETQLLTTFKVSQSIFENTGINIYYSLRNNLNKSSSISLTEFMYSDDEDLWDDPFSFEGSDLGSEFLQILPWDMTFKISGQYSTRRYKENLADSLNLRQRHDGRTELWFGLSKEFNSVPLLNSIELGVEYMHIINSSSENYFTYKNNLFLFRAGVSF